MTPVGLRLVPDLAADDADYARTCHDDEPRRTQVFDCRPGRRPPVVHRRWAIAHSGGTAL
jgi:hypothetical protein